jgi:hypothetical protein
MGGRLDEGGGGGLGDPIGRDGSGPPRRRSRVLARRRDGVGIGVDLVERRRALLDCSITR